MQTNPGSTTFPVIGVGKFTLLYFLTGGLFSLYWFYRCWSGVEKINGRRYMKVGRAVFSVLFVYELFQILLKEERKKGIDYSWRPERLAWVFIGAAIGQVLLTYGVEKLQLDCWARLLTLALGLVLQFYSLYQAQLALNRIEGDPFGRRNQSLTMQNHIWIVVGIYMWIRLIINCLYPPPVVNTAVPPLTPATSSTTR